jgi:Carbohydrate-selective porin, OprB family
MRARKPAAGCSFLVIALAGAMMAASHTARAAESANQHPSVAGERVVTRCLEPSSRPRRAALGITERWRADHFQLLTYQAQITHDWSVQPDFQYIVHPGGHAPSPSDPSGMSVIPNAMVFGVRSVSKF